MLAAAGTLAPYGEGAGGGGGGGGEGEVGSVEAKEIRRGTVARETEVERSWKLSGPNQIGRAHV